MWDLNRGPLERRASAEPLDHDASPYYISLCVLSYQLKEEIVVVGLGESQP